MTYEDPKQLSKTTKSGIRVISEMSTARILLFVTNKHRVGLLALGNVAFMSYFAWDKLSQFLF